MCIRDRDKNVAKRKIGILGAGTWGMALARMLCVSGNDVQVWSALPAEVENLSCLLYTSVQYNQHAPARAAQNNFWRIFTMAVKIRLRRGSAKRAPF